MAAERAGSLERAAYHEAGHAVMTVRLGLALRSVDIKEQDDRLGVSRSGRLSKWMKELEFIPNIVDVPPKTRYRIEGEIMVLWSGMEAELKYLGLDYQDERAKETLAGFGHVDVEGE